MNVYKVSKKTKTVLCLRADWDFTGDDVCVCLFFVSLLLVRVLALT